MRYWIAAVAILLGLDLFATVQACTPQPASAESVAKVLAGSDHAFRGTVAEVAAHPTDTATGRVRFAVERVYKGAPAAGEWYRYLKFSSAHCGGWTPTPGQRAIFFVYRHERITWATLLWGLYDNERLMEEALRLAGEKR
jgi:hypothetical protein